MLKLPEACKLVIKGLDFQALKFGSKQYSLKEKELLSKVLFAEKEIFSIYLKTGKSAEKTFSYEMLKSSHFMKKEETQN